MLFSDKAILSLDISFAIGFWLVIGFIIGFAFFVVSITIGDEECV